MAATGGVDTGQISLSLKMQARRPGEQQFYLPEQMRCSWKSGSCFYKQFDPRPGLTSILATIAIERSYRVEFYAKPVWQKNEQKQPAQGGAYAALVAGGMDRTNAPDAYAHVDEQSVPEK